MSDVLAVAEHRRGDLREVSLEVVSAARDLAADTDGDVHVVVVGGDVDGYCEKLNRTGVDAVHGVAHGEEFNHDVTVQAVAQLVRALDPEPAYVVGPNSVNGLDSLPALATRLGWAYVPDALAFEVDDGDLVATRERFGAKVRTTVSAAAPAVVSVRGGEWPRAEGVGDATVERFDATIDADAVRSRVTGFEEVGGGDVDITDAEFVVAVGRGIGEESELALVEDLVEATGATLAASRPIVDNGWLPKSRQVGQSGKQVAPRVYLAIGISGAVQHVAGMKGSDVVVAINTDPDAPIFDVADYGVVGDLFDVVPALVEEFA
ncbi:MAG: electron transfer flavoprotein subunit alpha/FixB family protein [Halobacteriaceae archaeon]